MIISLNLNLCLRFIFFISFLFFSITSVAQFSLKKESGSVSVVYKIYNKQNKEQSLKVYLQDSDVAVLGTIKKNEQEISFKPLVPFKADLNYRAVFGNEIYDFHLAPKGNDFLQVKAIYPSADTLPSNLLKIYFVFSEPIGPGQVYEAIQLYNSKDELMPEAFVNLGVELWNESKTRLTMWLDPGRIKRDLLRNQVEGEVLELGENYKVKVNSNLTSTSSNSLQNTFIKEFYAGNADREKPKIVDWVLNSSSKSLEIIFPEVMDYATALKMIEVRSDNLLKIEGKWALSNLEKKLTFTPKEPFIEGKYQLKINTLIEDWAANNLNTPFDREIGKEEKGEGEYQYITFWVD